MEPTTMLLQLLLSSIFAAVGVSALEVTPNSPCASFCINSKNADYADPNFSSTGNADIVCDDSDYTSTKAGQKFQQCVSCLQDSAFVDMGEDDQSWFLYNVRYSFNYCIFGFPEAENIASTPCSTSTACEPLMGALTGNFLEDTTPDYSYCDADGGIMGSESVQDCLSCVSALDNQNYLANFLIALNAGCEQQPVPGTLIGLSDTVFSVEEITSTGAEYESSSDDDAALELGAIVGIAVGGGALLLIIAGITFVCHRKRQKRRSMIGGGDRNGNSTRSYSDKPTPGGFSGRPFLHRRPSSLSFKCQTHLSPRSPAFQGGVMETPVEEIDGGAAAAGPYSSQTSSAYPFSASSYGYHTPGGTNRAAAFPVSPISPASVSINANNNNNGYPGDEKKKSDFVNIPLHYQPDPRGGITADVSIVTAPENVYHSTSPKAAYFPTSSSPTTSSPVSYANYHRGGYNQYHPSPTIGSNYSPVEPMSTTSTRSTAYLLPVTTSTATTATVVRPSLTTTANPTVNSSHVASGGGGLRKYVPADYYHGTQQQQQADVSPGGGATAGSAAYGGYGYPSSSSAAAAVRADGGDDSKEKQQKQQQQQQQAWSYSPPRRGGNNTQNSNLYVGAGIGMNRKGGPRRTSANNGSPVEVRRIDVSFPGPPTGR